MKKMILILLFVLSLTQIFSYHQKENYQLNNTPVVNHRPLAFSMNSKFKMTMVAGVKFYKTNNQIKIKKVKQDVKVDLQKNDVLLSLNGEKISSLRALYKELKHIKHDEVVELVVLRNDEKITVEHYATRMY